MRGRLLLVLALVSLFGAGTAHRRPAALGAAAPTLTPASPPLQPTGAPAPVIERFRYMVTVMPGASELPPYRLDRTFTLSDNNALGAIASWGSDFAKAPSEGSQVSGARLTLYLFPSAADATRALTAFTSGSLHCPSAACQPRVTTISRVVPDARFVTWENPTTAGQMLAWQRGPALLEARAQTELRLVPARTALEIDLNAELVTIASTLDQRVAAAGDITSWITTPRPEAPEVTAVLAAPMRQIHPTGGGPEALLAPLRLPPPTAAALPQAVVTAAAPVANLPIAKVDEPLAAAPTRAPARYAGVARVDGDPLEGGALLIAHSGGVECGRSGIGARGQFALEIAAREGGDGCGVEGAPINFLLVPDPNQPAPLDLGLSPAFHAGAAETLTVDLDTAALPANPANLTVYDWTWADYSEIAFSATCHPVSEQTLAAVGGALQWWSAAAQRGLRTRLTLTDEACRTDRPAIVIYEDTRPSLPQLVMNSAFSKDDASCQYSEPCAVHSGWVIINKAHLGSVSPDELTRLVARGIARTLGLGPAAACTGGTIMREEGDCRLPRRALGVDDIAAINQRGG